MRRYYFELELSLRSVEGRIELARGLRGLVGWLPSHVGLRRLGSLGRSVEGWLDRFLDGLAAGMLVCRKKNGERQLA